MKLIDTILISLSIVFMLVGIHQTYLNGIAGSYIFFMTMLSLLALYQLRKLNKENKAKTPIKSKKSIKKA
jgi:hypothetical protein